MSAKRHKVTVVGNGGYEAIYVDDVYVGANADGIFSTLNVICRRIGVKLETIHSDIPEFGPWPDDLAEVKARQREAAQ